MDLTGVTAEDALAFIVEYLRSGRTGEYSRYGYGLYLPNVVRAYLEHRGVPQAERETVLDQQRSAWSTPFYSAAWELCRRGILRPGIAVWGSQATDDGSGGNGYSLTAAGAAWIHQADDLDVLTLQGGRFATMLSHAASRFGEGFRERAREGLAAYDGHAFLACCAMCGAAAESIILSLAVSKSGDEQRILNVYSSSGGRGRIEALILTGQAQPVQDEFHRYVGLLKYWRDSSSHGRAVRISEPEAYSSIILLLRFARWAEDRWVELTG